MASRTHKVDYALLLDDAPIVFVEAKGCDTSLDDSNRDQLRTYMKTQDINWGLLTNGKTNEVFQREVKNGQVKVHRLGVTKIGELTQKSNLLSALSKQSIESGEAKKIARKINEIQRTKRQLRENKENIAESIARTVADKVGDSISQQAENEAKTLVDNLIAELDDGSAVKPTILKPSDDFWTEVEQEIGIAKRDDEVILCEDKSGAKQLRDFVAFLHEHGNLEETDLPVKSGGTRYLLNSEPLHQQGEDMVRPKQVGDNIYVETHNNTKNKKEFMLELSERFS